MAPLLLLGTALLPALTRLLAGERGGQIADAVTGVVKTVTGTDDPGEARARLDADPVLAAQLQQRLAELALEGERLRFEDADKTRNAELARLRAELGELRNARDTMVSLSAQGSKIAWGAPAVSVIVTVGFFVLLALLLWSSPGKDSIDPQAWGLLNLAVGALVAGFASVINFWIGSSQGSREKDTVVKQLTNAALTQTQTAVTTVATQASNTQAAVSQAVTTAIQSAREMIGPPAPPPAPAPAPALPVPSEAWQAAPIEGRADQRFLPCLTEVLRHEGGFVNDPADPGGATNLGITKATLEAWRGHPVSEEDVRELALEEAREIYRARYWNVLRCDSLPPGIDLMVFDFGVNAGPGAGARMLQRAVGVKVDGAIGPITIAAAKAADPSRAIDQMARLREEHYRGLGGFERFGRGWLRRTDEVRRAAQAMAAGA